LALVFLLSSTHNTYLYLTNFFLHFIHSYTNVTPNVECLEI
jgi:hypothetical protein